MLSPRQEQFCLNYAQTGNAPESYKKAGYNPQNDNVANANASRLLKNANIQSRLRELAEQIQSDQIASIEEIQRHLTSVLRRQEKENVVVTIVEEVSTFQKDADGVPRKVTKKREKSEVVQIPSRITDSIRAAEILAKMKGAFTTDVNINGAIPVVIHGEEDLED